MKTIARMFVLVSSFLVLQTSANSQEWVRACSQGEMCTIDGVRVIRYGANRFSYGVATNRVICSNDTFQDPEPGVRKACWYQETASERRYAALIQERDRQIDQLRARSQRLQSEIGTLRSELTALRTEVDDAYAELETLYERLGPGQRKRLRREERRERNR